MSGEPLGTLLWTGWLLILSDKVVPLDDVELCLDAAFGDDALDGVLGHVIEGTSLDWGILLVTKGT